MEIESIFVHLGNDYNEEFSRAPKPVVNAEVFIKGIGKLKVSAALSEETLESLKTEIIAITKQKLGMKEYL